MVVSKDKSEALITYVQVLNRPNYRSRKLKLAGLNPEFEYVSSDDERIYGGDILMNAGLIIQNPWGDFKSKLIHLKVK